MSPDLYRCAIAKLLSQTPDMSQLELAKQLDTNQSNVSRIIEELRRENHLSKRWHVAPQLLLRPEWARMEDELFGVTALGKTISEHAPRGLRERFRLRIVASAPAATPKGSRNKNGTSKKAATDGDLRPDHFGELAAAAVGELIAPVKFLGVGCGKTLEAVIRELLSPGYAGPIPQRPIIPIIAEPAHLRNTQQSPAYSATHLAESLRPAFSGEAHAGAPVLRGVPAYLPRRFRTREVRQMVAEVSGYRTIFVDDSKKAPLIGQLDGILTGAGTVSPGMDEWQGTLIRERIVQEQSDPEPAWRSKVSSKYLDKIIYGDLAGLLISKDGISADDEKVVKELNEGLVGLQERHLKDVCLKAGRNGSPGTILAACGSQKVGLIAAGIHRGLVTTLVTTRRCAEQVAAWIAQGN